MFEHRVIEFIRCQGLVNGIPLDDVALLLSNAGVPATCACNVRKVASFEPSYSLVRVLSFGLCTSCDVCLRLSPLVRYFPQCVPARITAFY